MVSDNAKKVKEGMEDESEDEKSILSLKKKKTASSSQKDAKLKNEESNKVKKEVAREDELSPRKKGFDKTTDTKAQSNSTQKQSKEIKIVKKEEAHDGVEQSSSKKLAPKISDKNKKLEDDKKKKKKKGAKEAELIAAKKREKKVYDLPGQKRDPPEERDPLRIFYETLYEQVPNSDMAAIWMMESGLLPKEEAKKVFERKQRKAQLQKFGSPMKTVSVVKKKVESLSVKKKVTSSSVSIQKKRMSDSKAPKPAKKRKNEDDDSEEESADDFELKMKKKAPDSKVGSKLSKKRKKDDSSEEDSDDDFEMEEKIPLKKQRVAP